MPLIIPKDLPAYEELQQENVFVMPFLVAVQKTVYFIRFVKQSSEITVNIQKLFFWSVKITEFFLIALCPECFADQKTVMLLKSFGISDKSVWTDDKMLRIDARFHMHVPFLKVDIHAFFFDGCAFFITNPIKFSPFTIRLSIAF